MKTRIAVAALALCLLAGGAARAEEQKGAATPAEALERLKKSAETGDTKLMEGLFAEPFGAFLSKMFAAGRRVMEASDDLKAAVQEKLGPEGVAALGKDPAMFTPRAFDGKIEIIDLKEEGDHATAMVRSTPKGQPAKDEPISLVKQPDGTWRIEPPKGPPPKDEDLAQMNAIADATAQSYRDIAAAVRKGEVKTVEELQKKKKEGEQAVMMKMFQEMQKKQAQGGGPGGGPHEPKGPTGTATPAPTPKGDGEK